MCAAARPCRRLIPQTPRSRLGVRVNQFFIAPVALLVVLAVALGALRLRGRSRKTNEGEHAPHRAVFEQSPHSALVVDATTLKVLDANPALQRNLGYTLDEVRALTANDLFADDSADQDALARRLRDPNPRSPLDIQQRAKDGTLRSVE